MALTEREKQILRLNAKGLNDYQIARKLRVETPNVYRARKTTLRKLDQIKADLTFAENLKSK